MNNNVAIIGAGIGGLTAALALIRRGIGVDVYEQAPELRELGAGVQISSNGTRVLYSLGLDEPINRLGVVVAGKEIRLWSTGQTWKLFDLGAVSVERYGFPYVMFHRGDLHSMLLEAIRRERPDAIHLNCKCVGVKQAGNGVTIAFENGKTASAPIVIGADGVQSRVRLSVFGADKPEFTGIVAWRILVPRERVPAGIRLRVGHNQFRFSGTVAGKLQDILPGTIGQTGFRQNDVVVVLLKLSASLLQGFHVVHRKWQRMQHAR